MREAIEEARRWVQYARWDLLDVKNNLQAEAVPYHIVCFHCQQAGEKMLKAALVLNEQPPPRTHDLVSLLERLKPFVPAAEEMRPHAATLNPFAVDIRYPDQAMEIGAAETEDARESVEAIVDWMKGRFPRLFA